MSSLNEVGGNPFGATLVVRSKELSGYAKILDLLSQPAYSALIEDKDFDDRQTLIARIESVSNRLQLAVFGISGVFAFIALLIVWNTVRMAIYSRRDELSVMRLVGASDWFIRGPFYAQALLWTFVALGCSLAFFLPTVQLAEPTLQRFLGSQSGPLSIFRERPFEIFGLEFLALAALSVFTAKMATAKYLKV